MNTVVFDGNGDTLSGTKRSCTESSNPARSASQSGVQRNQAAFLWKSLENAVILRFSRSNRTRESVPSYSAGEVCGTFLWSAETQSGFDEPTWRMQCDHKLVIGQKLLDFPASLSPSASKFGYSERTNE